MYEQAYSEHKFASAKLVQVTVLGIFELKHLLARTIFPSALLTPNFRFCFWSMFNLRWPCLSPLQTFIFVLSSDGRVCVPSPSFHFCFMRPPNHGQYLTSDGRVCPLPLLLKIKTIFPTALLAPNFRFCFCSRFNIRWPCLSPLQTVIFDLSSDGRVRPLSKLSFLFRATPGGRFFQQQTNL